MATAMWRMPLLNVRLLFKLSLSGSTLDLHTPQLLHLLSVCCSFRDFVPLIRTCSTASCMQYCSQLRDLLQANMSSCVQQPLLEYIDVWAQREEGQPIAVVVLSQLHMLELSAAAQGWVCAICKALHRCLPHVAVLMPAGGHADTPSVQEQLWAQLRL